MCPAHDARLLRTVAWTRALNLAALVPLTCRVRCVFRRRVHVSVILTGPQFNVPTQRHASKHNLQWSQKAEGSYLNLDKIQMWRRRQFCA